MFLSGKKCIAGFFILQSITAFSQSKLDSIQHIDEVLVIGNQYREVIPSQKLTAKKLEALNSFSVADAIRYFSGIQVKDYGGIGGLKTVDIRSMGTNHMGVFYDGIQLGNAQNGQIDLGKFSLDNIEEISLYNGQKSEIFQSAKDFGSAGTIYLRTKRPQFIDGKNTNLKAIFRTGSFDLVNPSFLWEQKINSNISGSLNAEYIYSSGRYKFRYKKVFHDGTTAWDTTATRKNGDIHALRLEGGINGSVQYGKWNLKSYYYDSERGIPGAIVNNVWKRSQRQFDRNFFAQGSLQKQVTEKYNMLVNAKYAYDYMRYLNPDTTLMYVDNTFRQQEFYISTAHKYAVLPQWDIDLSADYQFNMLDATLQDFVYPKRNTFLVAMATAFEWRGLKTQASFLATFIGENVTRIQHGSGDQLPGTQTGTPSNKQEYTPAVFISYSPFSHYDFNVRAFYKRIFRMPTFNDLYYTDVGNIALNPEFTTQYNVGFQFKKELKYGLLKNFSLKADAYYIEVDNKIIAVPKGNGQYRWMMMNLGYVEIRGIDLSQQMSWNLPKEIVLNTGLNFTYQKAQDFSDPTDNDPVSGTYGGQIAYIPWYNGSFTAALTRKLWDINYSFIYVGERYHNSSNIRENYEKPWYTSDIAIGRQFNWKTFNLKLTLQANNILNQQYDVIINYPMPGRNYKLTLKIDL